jgi:hypothetical protein
MGDTIGYGFQVTMNAKASNLYAPVYGGCCAASNPNRQLALMGDPTLRMQMVKPPTGLQVGASAGALSFSWAASSEPVLGYHVYRLTPSGPLRLTQTLVTGTSFVSALPASTPSPAGNFMVRAVKLTTSESGSYYNLSLGALNP